MEEKRKISYYVTHPWAIVFAGVGLIGHGFALLDPLVHLIGSTAGMWFPLLGLFRTASGMVNFIPAALAQNVFLAGIAVYALYLLTGLLDRVRQFIEKRL